MNTEGQDHTDDALTMFYIARDRVIQYALKGSPRAMHVRAMAALCVLGPKSYGECKKIALASGVSEGAFRSACDRAKKELKK